MPSTSKKAFDDNKKDIEGFWKIHEKAAGSGRGRKHKVEVLNRAVIVFVTACWEAYVEDVAHEALGHVFAAAPVAPAAATALRAIAGNKIDRLNTPKTSPVTDLFKSVLGLPRIHTHWKWQRMTAKGAGEKLDEFVALRGSIAHRVGSKSPVGKNVGVKYLNHVERLVEKTDEAVAQHLKKLTGTKPW
jgi:hypothetical protein